jgi:peptidoglycan hydrolase-like protein with peptidoglycan-binding domain
MSEYQRGARGPEILRLQIRLQELGAYTRGLDDVFGPGLEAAVRALQQWRGLPVTGVVDGATWRAAFAEPSPRLAALRDRPVDYRVLSLTAGFETGTVAPECFQGLAGNFDRQGISFGVLQWNLGQGTLQPLLARLDARHPRVVREAFGDGYEVLRQVLERARTAQLAWADTIQAPGARTLVEPWRSRFRALGAAPECQALQVELARERFSRAEVLCAGFGLWSQRAAALMFDILVQNGSIGGATRERILADFQAIPAGLGREAREVERMRIVANRRAEAANPAWVEDVRRRKLTIAEGVGIVHGRGYDLEHHFDLRLLPLAPVLAPLPAAGGD